MSQVQVIEGVWEDVLSHHAELAGRRVKVYVEPQEPSTQNGMSKNKAPRPLYETATPEEWAQALYAWASSHDPNTPPLSEEAVSRESIYEGRGE